MPLTQAEIIELTSNKEKGTRTGITRFNFLDDGHRQQVALALAAITGATLEDTYNLCEKYNVGLMLLDHGYTVTIQQPGKENVLGEIHSFRKGKADLVEPKPYSYTVYIQTW